MSSVNYAAKDTTLPVEEAATARKILDARILVAVAELSKSPSDLAESVSFSEYLILFISAPHYDDYTTSQSLIFIRPRHLPLPSL